MNTYHTKRNIYTNYRLITVSRLYIYYVTSTHESKVDLMHRATDRHTHTGAEERSHTLHVHCTYTHIQNVNTDTASLVSKG
jgi:hypothetical protein